jgi:adenylosuccinate synthase
MEEAYRHFLKRSDAPTLFRTYRQILWSTGATIESSQRSLLDSVMRGRKLIFEGAQGALLDRQRGFPPYVTKSDTTCRNALELMSESGLAHQPFKLGVLRTYGHRHGAGPFVTEDESLRPRFDDELNSQNPWQGRFRVGWMDLPALRYGIRLNGGVDGLAVTGLDRLSGLETIYVCSSYREPLGQETAEFPADGRSLTEWVTKCQPQGWIELPGWQEDISHIRRFADLPFTAQAYIRFLESAEGLGVPIEIASVGPRSDQKIFLRS